MSVPSDQGASPIDAFKKNRAAEAHQKMGFSHYGSPLRRVFTTIVGQDNLITDFLFFCEFNEGIGHFIIQMLYFWAKASSNQQYV